MKPFLSFLFFFLPMLVSGQTFYANNWQPSEKAFNQNITNKADNKANTQTYIGAGINDNFSSFGLNEIEYGLDNQPNLSSKLDFGIKWLKNNISPNLFFKADISITLIKPRFNIYFDPRLIDPLDPILGGPYPALNAKIIFKQVSIALNPAVDYNFINKNNYQLFVGVAASFNLIKNFDFAHYDLQNDKNNQIATYNSPDIYKFKNILINYSLQSGITFNKKIELIATYAPKTILNNVIVKVENQFIGLGVNYLFNK